MGPHGRGDQAPGTLMGPNLSGKRATVMGLGLFGGGVAVARYLHRKGARVLVTDIRPEGSLRESLEDLRDLDLRFRLGEHREEDFTETDLVIANPAVRPDSPFLRLARSRGVPISSEVDLLLEACPAPTLAVTGTNGKSTTTALAGKILGASGRFRRVWTGGNIGRPLLELVDEIRPEDLVALEVSSFQLETLRGKGGWPRVAVLTRLGQDHLDRHGSFEAYVDAKARILESQGPGDAAVLNADDPVAWSWAGRCKGRVLGYGRPGADIHIEDGWVAKPTRSGLLRILPTSEVRLPGRFNLENVMAAVAAVLDLGVSPATIRAAVRGFPGLEHRLEFLGEQQGIRFYNNAVSTTPESTLSAIEALPRPIVLVAGGKGKNLDLGAFAGAIAAETRLCAIYGAAAASLALAAAQAGAKDLVVVETLGQALDFLLPRLEAGDNLLFSPAFSSYDQYRNFRERGEEFRRRVRDWIGAEVGQHTAARSSNSLPING